MYMEHTDQVARRISILSNLTQHLRSGHQHHRITIPLTQGRLSVRVEVDGEANSSNIMDSQGRYHSHDFSSAANFSQVRMDIHLHTAKGVTRLNRALKGITTPTASKVLTVDLSKSNMVITTNLFEAVTQAIVVTTHKIRIADSLARVPLLQTRTMLPLPPGEEGDTSKIFSGLQEMQVLTVEAVVNIISNPLQGICRPLLIHNPPQVNRAMTTIRFDLRKTCRLRTRARKTQRCHPHRDKNPNLHLNRSQSSALPSKLNL